MEAIITTLTSSIGIGTLVFFLLKYFLGEKFKNMATLQDIGAITREVESVKQVFTNQTEGLKHSLAVLTNKESVLFNEEKDALYLFYSAWQVWFNKLTKINVNYTPSSRETLDDILKGLDFTEYDDEFNIVMISMSKLELFLNDEKIIQLAKTLNNKSLDYLETIEYFLRGNFIERDEMNARMRELKQAQLNKDINAQMEVSILIKEIAKEMQIAFIDFTTNKKNKLLEVNIALGTFIDESRKYIRKDFII